MKTQIKIDRIVDKLADLRFKESELKAELKLAIEQMEKGQEPISGLAVKDKENEV